MSVTLQAMSACSPLLPVGSFDVIFTYANALPVTTLTGSNSALPDGTKGTDQRYTDNDTGKSNASGRPTLESWEDQDVHRPEDRVSAECSSCGDECWLEHFDPKEPSVPVAFAHLLPGREGVEQRCRSYEEGVKGSQGVYRPKDKKRKSIISGSLL